MGLLDFRVLGNVWSRMVQRNVVLILLALNAMLVGCSRADGVVKNVTACYGNFNNYLRLSCGHGKLINVLKVVHGAKLKSSMTCISPASQDTYDKACCVPSPTDCTIIIPGGASVQCQNQPSCDAVATWSDTNKGCDQNEYPAATNYMLMEYSCENIEVESKGSFSIGLPHPLTTTLSPTTLRNTTTTRTTTVRNTTTTRTTTLNRDVVVITNGTAKPTTQRPSKPAASSEIKATDSEDELSDAMVGAIVGGSVGMLLTLVAFIFYWGRKRRLRIVGKPQPTVWDYLLSQTFTVRGTHGYDHFSSVRSTASSDGDSNSPVVRKNMWLPNIVHKDESRSNSDDIISNYENDPDKDHRVEIHHNATPAPYAFLNLDVNNTNSQANLEV